MSVAEKSEKKSGGLGEIVSVIIQALLLAMKSSRMPRWPLRILRLASASENQPALSTSGNSLIAPDRGGHSMHHLFIDQMRKVNRRGEAAILPLDANEAQAVPAEQAENAASREIIDALQAISPERRAALVMVAIEGFSYAEAANILGVPAGTLMSRIARGREELRGLLDDTARRRAIRIVEK